MASKSLYVGNLPYQATERELRDLFSAYEVSEIRIIPDKGFGFVEVAEEKAAEAIEAVNGASFGGRNLTVNEARPRGERPSGGGGNRGGYGGGGGGGSDRRNRF